jgi:hypothetical protein
MCSGTGVVLRPWLQAFRWKTKTYSPQYIQTQVRVSKEKGGIGFLFWNAGNDYSKPFAAMPLMRADAARYFSDPALLPAGSAKPVPATKPVQAAQAEPVAPAN